MSVYFRVVPKGGGNPVAQGEVNHENDLYTKMADSFGIRQPGHYDLEISNDGRAYAYFMGLDVIQG